MFKVIKKIIGGTSVDTDDAKAEEQDVHLALCVLLLEAAHVDGECSDEEVDHIVETLAAKGDTTRAEVEQLLELSRKERKNAIDLFRFTRYMNNSYSHQEKIDVMESVWRVILTDGYLEAHEDHFAHKLANLLRLTHKELIDAKIKARRQLQ